MLFVRIAVLGLLVASYAAAAEPPRDSETARLEQNQQIQRLIQQLGDRDYFVRQRAEAELTKIGFDAFDALSEATASDDLETAARARHLLSTMKVDWADPSDPPEVKQLLRDYDDQPVEGRLAKIRALVVLPGEAGIPALCRIVRYEKAALLSKQAAVELLAGQKAAQPPRKETVELVRKHLAESRRPGAQWLLTWIRVEEDPNFTANWTKLVDAEEAMLRASPSQTSPDVVAALLRFQITRMKRLGLTTEVVAAIRRLIQLEKGDPETLGSLLEWLVEQKAWKAVDELSERFGPQISINPALLYSLAEAQAAQGNKERAEQTAERAFKLNPGVQSQDLIAHLMAAASLQQRGQFPWAKREYQYVIAKGQPTNEITLTAQIRLSEMLHDQGRNLEAGEVLQALEKVFAANVVVANPHIAGRTLNEVRARMYYFLACHWQAGGDPRKYREFLAKALAADAADLDVLIATYHLPDQTPAERQKNKQLIEKAAADLREQIADEPDSPSPYNQLAWLIGNTEGDFDEALRCSLKSIELSPDRDVGGYYDTLAHVYAGKGDYENAVKSQTKAIELDPHSALIQRKLELFRKKLEESKKTKEKTG